MKNKLFLVALATVTVLGPSLVTPHHQTVHAAEQTKEPQTNSMTCTRDGSVCAGWHSLTEEEDSITSNSSSKTNTSPLAWLWSLITSLWISATSLFT
ncbi:SpoV family signaling peptide [Streptococcus pyogenes]|uniref:SpoV family signaling peptide n=1 Tax=Streptococcus pyogenes TaxID=1314 RepID=UPI00109CEFB2|nr:SpoV family signaling peptide [Streptococcus pyogenes]